MSRAFIFTMDAVLALVPVFILMATVSTLSATDMIMLQKSSSIDRYGHSTLNTMELLNISCKSLSYVAYADNTSQAGAIAADFLNDTLEGFNYSYKFEARSLADDSLVFQISRGNQSNAKDISAYSRVVLPNRDVCAPELNATSCSACNATSGYDVLFWLDDDYERQFMAELGQYDSNWKFYYVDKSGNNSVCSAPKCNYLGDEEGDFRTALNSGTYNAVVIMDGPSFTNATDNAYYNFVTGGGLAIIAGETLKNNQAFGTSDDNWWNSTGLQGFGSAINFQTSNNTVTNSTVFNNSYCSLQGFDIGDPVGYYSGQWYAYNYIIEEGKCNNILMTFDCEDAAVCTNTDTTCLTYPAIPFLIYNQEGTGQVFLFAGRIAANTQDPIQTAARDLWFRIGKCTLTSSGTSITINPYIARLYIWKE
jgi:hypothetical protein